MGALAPIVRSGSAGTKAAAWDRGKEARSLEHIYRTHVGFVWRVVHRLGVPSASIEDLVQEAFLVARRRLVELDADIDTRGWLYTIARGVVANDRRGRQRRERRHLEADPPASSADPEQLAVQTEAIRVVERFLARLSDDQRIVFELVDIEGFTGPEVAKAVNVPLDTVYSRLRLARAAFERHCAARRERRTP